MIHYSLVCESEHAFEGWFRSSEDFERQTKMALVACPVCGSTTVHRGLMAPSVLSGRDRDATRNSPPPVATEAPKQPMMLPDPAQLAMLEALRELRAKITEGADYVGERFADEARRMHYGETDKRGIYGEASVDEAKALAEEGIPVSPLPTLPDDRN
jgi:hypothetical protein